MDDEQYRQVMLESIEAILVLYHACSKYHYHSLENIFTKK